MATINYSLRQGEDLIMEIPIYDKLTNLAVDLSTATDIIVTLTMAKAIQGKYSLTPISGYGNVSLKVGVGNEHILEVQVKRADSKIFAVGYLQANVLVELPDVLLIAKRTEYVYPSFALVYEGLTKSEPID